MPLRLLCPRLLLPLLLLVLPAAPLLAGCGGECAVVESLSYCDDDCHACTEGYFCDVDGLFGDHVAHVCVLDDVLTPDAMSDAGPHTEPAADASVPAP